MATNVYSVFAACHGMSPLSLHPSKEDADRIAASFEPFYVNGYANHGYSVELHPGMLNDELYQGSDGQNDYIQDPMGNGFVRPKWLRMTGKVIPTPKRLEGYAHREF
jgi:hypothetical protein